MRKTLIILSLLFSSTIANENQKITDVVKNSSFEPNYFSMIFGLFVVVALIYITGFLYQKLIKIKIGNTNTNEHKINVLNTTSMGQGRNLHVVNIGKKNILIGSTQNNITYITNLDDTKKLGEKENDKNC